MNPIYTTTVIDDGEILQRVEITEEYKINSFVLGGKTYTTYEEPEELQ